MTDIFFSYSSKDREKVRPVGDALIAQGFDVFWDQAVPAGVDWDNWIRQHLAKSKCAVVFWSKNSVASDNVRHEATVAKQQGKLVPVLLEPLGADNFPMGLYSVQCANLENFSGGLSHPEWQKLQREVEAKLTPPWVRRALDGVEAQLVAERARREAAERRDQTLQDQIATEAQSQQDLKRERDRSLAEVAALKAQLAEAARARAELDARAVALSHNRSDADLLQAALTKRQEELDALKAEREALQRRCEELGKTARTSEQELNILKRLPKLGSSVDIPKLGFTNCPQLFVSAATWSFLKTAIGLCIFLAVWEIAALLMDKKFILPDIVQVARSLYEMGPTMLSNTVSTFSRLSLGWLVGVGLGLLLLKLASMLGRLAAALGVLSSFTRWLPPPVVAMLSVMWWGIGGLHLAMVAGLVSFATVLQESAMAKGLLPWRGLHAAVIAALTWGVTAEALGSETGIGFLMMQSSLNFNIAEFFGIGVWFVGLCLAVDLIIRKGQRLLRI